MCLPLRAAPLPAFVPIALSCSHSACCGAAACPICTTAYTSDLVPTSLPHGKPFRMDAFMSRGKCMGRNRWSDSNKIGEVYGEHMALGAAVLETPLNQWSAFQSTCV